MNQGFPGLKRLRAFYRLLLFAFYTMLRISQIIFSSLLFGVDMQRSMRIRQSWAKWLLPHIGVRMHVEGRAPDFPCIIVGNHRSYLDPVIIIHDMLGYPVSKAEVAGWPIIGYGAKVTGVLFLKRESAASRRNTLQGIAEKVKEGFPVLLFPEGTTHAHPQTVDFRAGAFKLAVNEGFPIVPVAVEYRSVEDYWIGNDTFLPHFFRRFGERDMHVYIRYGTAIQPTDAPSMMHTAKTWIDAELLKIQKAF